MEETLQKVYEYLATNGLNLVYALLILIVGHWVSVLAGALVQKGLARTKVDITLHGFIAGLAKTGIFVFVILAVLERLGVRTTSFVAVLAAAGFAIGLALQGALANFAAGVLLIVFKPFRIGDYVEVAGTAGTIRRIEIFNTILDSPDNRRIIVPNAQVTGGNITNYTINGTRRVDMTVGVSYDDDLRKAREVIAQVLRGEERILAEPAPVIAVSQMADSSVNLVVRPWVKTPDYWAVYFDLTEKIKIALDDNGITIPYPQRDVYIKEMAAKS